MDSGTSFMESSLRTSPIVMFHWNVNGMNLFHSHCPPAPHMVLNMVSRCSVNTY